MRLAWMLIFWGLRMNGFFPPSQAPMLLTIGTVAGFIPRVLVNCTFSLSFSKVSFNKMQMELFESCFSCVYRLLLLCCSCRCVSLGLFVFYFLCLLGKWKHMDSLFGPSGPYRIVSLLLSSHIFL